MIDSQGASLPSRVGKSLAGIGICYTELTSSAANRAANSAMVFKGCVSLATRAMDRDSFPSGKIASSPSPPLETPMQDRPTKTTPDLFTPIAIGPLALPNRIAMAPLTRSRAGGRQRADRAQRALLRAARERRADHLGSDASGAGGPGLYLDARHPQRRADQRLAMRDRRGARLAAAASCSSSGMSGASRINPSSPAANCRWRPRPSSRTDRPSPPTASSRSQRPARSSSPRSPASSRNMRKGRGTRWQQASTASRCMARTAI